MMNYYCKLLITDCLLLLECFDHNIEIVHFANCAFFCVFLLVN